MLDGKYVVVISTLALCGMYITGVESLFKMSKVKCESLNESVITINECRLRAVRRGISTLYINLTAARAYNDVQIQAILQKKTIRYQTNLVNVTVDFCQFMEKRKSFFGNLVYNMIKTYTNCNHTCPYEGNLEVAGFYPKREYMESFPIPNGEYVLHLAIGDRRKKALFVSTYFDYEDGLF